MALLGSTLATECTLLGAHRLARPPLRSSFPAAQRGRARGSTAPHSTAQRSVARAMAGPPLHPNVEPISFLLGTWRGEGEGSYPTISSFKYGEEVTFGHVGKPVVSYSQKTWKAATGEPMHAESGYWRPKPDGTIDIVIAQSTGMTEVEKGSYDAQLQQVNVESSSIGNATKVTRVARKFTLEGGALKYEVFMATTTQPLELHLSALLQKVSKQ